MPKTHLLFILFNFLLCTPLVVSSQGISYTVENYGLDDGLPTNRIFSLVQHSSGFIYAGTTQGLYRFDGKGFIQVQVVQGNDIVTRGTIFSAFEISEGKLLMIASTDGSAFGKGKQFLYDPILQVVESISIAQYDVLLEEAQKRLEATGTKYNGQTNIDGTVYHNYIDRFGNTLKTSSDKNGVNQALLSLSSGEQISLNSVFSTLLLASSPRSLNLGEVLYFGGHNGLIKIALKRTPFQLFFHEEGAEWEYRKICRSMVQTSSDSILVSVEKQGLHFLNIGHQSYSKADFEIKGASPDLNTYYFRSLWLNETNGLAYGTHLKTLVEIDLSQNLANALTPEASTVLASTYAEDIGYIIAGETAIEHEYDMVVVDKENGELEYLSFHSGKEFLFNARPTFILSASDSSVWYGTKSGLFLLDVVNQKILHLYIDKAAEKKDYPFPVSYTLNGSHIWVLHLSTDGKLWIGMHTTGINILNVRTQEIEHLDKSNGLSNNTVVGILPDKEGYWFSTFNGLSYYDTTTTSFRNYYRSNGISHNEFNRFSFLIDNTGKYYFGSMNGITAFYPDDVLRREEHLDLLVSEIRHFDSKGNSVLIANYAFQSSPVEIPSANRFLSVKMTITDYKEPQGNSFFYKLHSTGRNIEEEKWNALGANNEVKFENLEAGDYELILRGVSSAGVYTREVAVPIKVNEFFYRTWWFIGGVLFIVSFMLFVLYRLRLRQAIKIERLRTKLSSDLHDDVGGLLSGVAFQMEALQHRVDPEIRPEISQVAQSSRKAMEQMRDTVWAIDPRRMTIGDLKDRMLESGEELLTPLDIAYSIDISAFTPATILSSEVRHNLLLIYKEFISNTIKHAKASKVEIHFLKNGKLLEMCLQDDGIGCDSTAKNRTGQGLKNMEMRAFRMKGTLHFLKGGGFGISVTVPLNHTTHLGG